VGDIKDETARALELAEEHERHHTAMTSGEWRTYISPGPMVAAIPPLVSQDDASSSPRVHSSGTGAIRWPESDAAGIAYLRNAAPNVSAVLRELVGRIRVLEDLADKFIDKYEDGLGLITDDELAECARWRAVVKGTP